ncbi:MULTISPECIES: hypothetical protein [Sphingobium]|uniref:Uncharacterized protein n=1 Tax=Sphingobium fuliginis ATCC 27551 TaxID=1208342 RepID=A0A5B8CIK4_SPHSA|nr:MULTISPECIES: hypothetical protein [Sphingobium]MCB4862731.1 hypothetical protein [Sphingobium sp. PNB]QDC37890.1 hypothetical protein FIL70_12240 [Sphingobium fuliginis ATCC 27551]
MHIIHTWQELAAYLDSPIPSDLKCLLQTRRDQLMEYGDLSELGIFAIIAPGDTMAAIEDATGWPILMEGTPTFEWVQRHGTIFEMPFVLSDSGAGHVLIVPDAEGIDPTLLDLCRAYADQPNGDSTDRAEGN